MTQAREERSLGDLFGELSRETNTLIRQEMQLAKAEMAEKATKIGKDLVFIILGAIILYTGVLALVFSAILGLAELIEPWVSALVIGLIIVAIGGFLAYRGYNQLQEVDPAPERTIETLKEDAEWLKEQVD